jgi:hypothetical protein
MQLKEELEAILKEYKARHKDLGPCDHVIFFANNEGDEVDHLLCYGPQIPAVMDFSKWYKPHMLVINQLGRLAYVYE